MEHKAMFARKTKRKEMLERYRRLRAISSRHAHAALKVVSRKLYIKTGKRLGLVHGRNLLVFDSEQEMTLLSDLALYSRHSGASVIERYRRTVDAPEGSDERAVLDAMCGWRFALLAVKGKHPVAGLVMEDLLRHEELWLMDESMADTAKPGLALASRLIRPDAFHMTTGVAVPIDEWLLLELDRTLPPGQRGPSLLEGRSDRFVETIYRTAIAMGTAERIAYG
jgi:hypothetical protein